VLQKHKSKTPLAKEIVRWSYAPRRPPLFIELAAAILIWLTSCPVWAQSAADISAAPTFSTGFKFAEQSGESLYKSVCQACHMPNAAGATGAAAYPSLAADPALMDRGYPAYVVIFGKRSMPAFGEMMSDTQVTAVVNYVRSHFGNSYLDEITVEEVHAARP
jgi:mono/diheme cytochrome c family protein